MEKQGRVSKHSKNSLSLIDKSNLSGNELKDLLKLRIDESSHVWLSHPDHRFQNTLSEQFSFNIYSQSFLINESIWDEATTDIRGISKHHEYLRKSSLVPQPLMG